MDRLCYYRHRITPDDIKSIRPKVKQMSRLAFDEGTACCQLASSLQSSNPRRSFVLYSLATEKFKETLMIRPHDVKALFNAALSCLQLSSIVYSKNIASSPLSSSSPYRSSSPSYHSSATHPSPELSPNKPTAVEEEKEIDKHTQRERVSSLMERDLFPRTIFAKTTLKEGKLAACFKRATVKDGEAFFFSFVGLDFYPPLILTTFPPPLSLSHSFVLFHYFAMCH